MPGSSSPRPKPKLSKENKAALKQTAKSFATKFGPVIFAGVAAAVKHHLNDDEERRDAAGGPSNARGQLDDRASDKTTDSELRREIRQLKRSMRRKEKEFLRLGTGRPSSEAPSLNSLRVNIPTITVQDHDNDHHDAPSSVRRLEQEGSFERKLPNNDYYQHPEDQFSTAEHSENGSSEEVVIATREADDDFDRPHHHRHHRYHHHHHLIHHPHLRNSSLPIHLPSKAREEELQAKAIEASKVAAITGAMEALLLTDYRGKWWDNGLAPKGKRVGTAVAAGFRTSWARGETAQASDGWEMAANVGRGLLITRIVHGSSQRVEEEWRDERRGRRRRRDSF